MKLIILMALVGMGSTVGALLVMATVSLSVIAWKLTENRIEWVNNA